MARQDNQRYEFVLHKARDAELVAYLAGRLTHRYSLADWVRDQIEADMHPEEPQVVQVSPDMPAEQRAFYEKMVERLERTPQPQVIESGGIDQSRPRRPKAQEGVTFAAEHLPKTTTPH